MKQLVFDHYGWLKQQKTQLKITVAKDKKATNDTSLQDSNILNVSNLKPLDILSLNDSIDVKKQVSKAAHGLRSIDVSVNIVEDSENIMGGFVANQS